MQFLPNLIYPETERSKLTELGQLFTAWHQSFAAAPEGGHETAANMIFDGFYPHYFAQNPRILFVGRETLEMKTSNYIQELYECYRSESKLIGDRHLNQYQFHYRMLYVAFGLLNGMRSWDEILPADKLSELFAEENGFSFAFMNLSKLANNSGFWKADENLIDLSYRLSTQSRNFIEEQIALLEPDIVIGMNFGDKFNSLGKISAQLSSSADVSAFWLYSCNHRSLLINSWHFSAMNKQNIRDFYDPICDAVRKNLPNLRIPA